MKNAFLPKVGNVLICYLFAVHCQRDVRLNMEELALSHEDPFGLSLY